VASLKAEGIDPAAYNTTINAADAIDLRRTLDIARDVFGESYGARLAQELMRRDAAAARAVLSSPLPVGPKFTPRPSSTFSGRSSTSSHGAMPNLPVLQLSVTGDGLLRSLRRVDR
jgi:pimeloyl-ACP methyl ester carboxylesterase